MEDYVQIIDEMIKIMKGVEAIIKGGEEKKKIVMKHIKIQFPNLTSTDIDILRHTIDLFISISKKKIQFKNKKWCC